jgi:Domain found in Dishevelled, Egl-10, and Pleckstrin (DEP)
MKDYQNCFIASEMIDFMIKKGWTKSRDEAVRLGQNLQFQFQWFEHVVEPRRHWFADKYLFFKFNSPEDWTSNEPQMLPTRMMGMPSHRQPSLSSLNEVSEHSSLES